MKQIDIICNDKTYTEMLRLELEACGYRTSDRYTGHGALVICDSSLKKQENCITFSFHDGADLVRPFAISELISLVEQRLENTGDTTESRDLWVCSDSAYAVCRGTQITLSELEHGILLYLYENRDKYVSQEELAEKFFGDGSLHNPVRVYISYLRNKLDETFGVKFIYTIRGKGYMLKVQ